MKIDHIQYHHRHSTRLQGYDYSLPAAYFVTIATYHHSIILGEVVDNMMTMNEYGEIAREEWIKSSALRPYIHLFPDEFVIMPNHMHGIVWIEDNRRGAATLRPYKKNISKLPNVIPHSLGATIRGYKSAVTIKTNKLRNSPGSPVWQRNFYDHIIRNQQEYQLVFTYIESNPVKWIDDHLHPSNISSHQ